MAFIGARINIGGIDLYKIIDRIAIGASFCQVDRIRHDIHEIEVITDGYHM